MGVLELYGSVQPGGISSPRDAREAPRGKPSGPSEFEKILGEKLNLSQHAETRIRSREIPWGQEIQARVNHGIDQARAKGSREALILLDDMAVIANVKSRTVITAMSKDQLKERVFTNIDSAVLA